MLEIAICDDDKNIINDIKECIEDYEGLQYTLNTYRSGEGLLKAEKSFDLIFLDVDMSGINGIETARKIRLSDRSVKIVYVTSYSDYMNSAFSVHAFGYVNKPVKREKIHNQLKEVLNYSIEEEEEEIEFLSTEGVIRLNSKDIYYFEYVNRKVNLKGKNKTYILKEKITSMGEKMKVYEFFMPHKSFVVNLFHVKSIKAYDIYMMDGSIIPLSQKKSTEFRDEFNIFLEKHI